VNQQRAAKIKVLREAPAVCAAGRGGLEQRKGAAAGRRKERV
jgi:hypothetical protein